MGHIAENCSSDQRLCYNCRQPGHESSACPSPRTVAAKQVCICIRSLHDRARTSYHLQCYSCGGVGHIQAECPSLRVNSPRCYVRRNCSVQLDLTPLPPRLIELWFLRAYRSLLLLQLWRNEFCFPCSASRPRLKYLHLAPREMLSLRGPQPHGQVENEIMFRCQ